MKDRDQSEGNVRRLRAHGDPLTLDSFTQPTNGTLADTGNGTLTYKPDAGFSGTDTFTYTVDDGNGGTDTATVTVTVSASPSPDQLNGLALWLDAADAATIQPR